MQRLIDSRQLYALVALARRGSFTEAAAEMSLTQPAAMTGGALAGLAGAYFSTVDLNVFLEEMTGGAGWIAVSMVIFGNWRPGGIVAAALIFGGAEALQLRLQGAGTGLPREFIVMIPYLLTLVALASRVRSTNSPRQLSVPYVRLGRE